MNGAAVQDHVMTDRDLIANHEWMGIMSDMKHAEVLHIRPIADPNVIHIASDHSMEPHAAIFTHDDIADYDSGLLDKA